MAVPPIEAWAIHPKAFHTQAAAPSCGGLFDLGHSESPIQANNHQTAKAGGTPDTVASAQALGARHHTGAVASPSVITAIAPKAANGTAPCA